MLGHLVSHVIADRSGGGMVLEDLLERYPGALERVAILHHGASGLLKASGA